jgi:thiol-disulfide isomerase/thioredoxin
MSDIAFGPIAFSLPLLVLAGAVFIALVVGNRLGLRNRTDVERSIWFVLGWTVLAARAGFVARYQAFYIGEPLRMLDIRDGGFLATRGLAAGLVAYVWFAWRHTAQRMPLGAALAAGCLVWGAGSAAISLAAHRQTLPRLTLPTLEGGTMALTPMPGKPVVLNLWASWCPPCRREMPVLARAQAEHPGVVFVFANQGESAEAVKDYLAAQRLAIHNVLLDGTTILARKTGSGGLPTTLFFNGRGELVDRRMGELSPATLAQGLALLREP